MKPLRHNLFNLLQALNEISSSDSFDNDTIFTTNTIIENIDFKFICSVCIWFEILKKIDQISKSLQSIKMNIQGALILIEDAQNFISDLRENGFEKMLAIATEIAHQNSINIDFNVAIGRKRREVGEVITMHL